MEDIPKIKIEFTTTDKVLEVLGWISIIIMWVWTIVNYGKLPDTIPTHYMVFAQWGRIKVVAIVCKRKMLGFKPVEFDTFGINSFNSRIFLHPLRKHPSRKRLLQQPPQDKKL